MSEIERAIEKKEYIERGAALELFWEYSGNWNLINAIPDADVEPVVRGWWVPNRRYDGCMVCDQCGFGIEAKTIVFVDCNRRSDEREFSICAGDLKLAYCPHCGAHMERSGNA